LLSVVVGCLLRCSRSRLGWGFFGCRLVRGLLRGVCLCGVDGPPVSGCAGFVRW
jgi:hypothetical protein